MKENHKTNQIPGLSPHYPETQIDVRFEGDGYGIESLLEL